MIPLLFRTMPAVSALGAVALGGLVLSRNPRTPLNRCFFLGMLSLAAMQCGQYMLFLPDAASVTTDPAFWQKVTLAGEILLPAPWLLFSLLFGRAAGKPMGRRVRIFAWAVAAASAAFLGSLMLGAFQPLHAGFPRFRLFFSVFQLLVLTVVLANFEVTLRAADPRQQWRIKYLILGIGGIFGFMVFDLSRAILFPAAAKSFSPVLPFVVFAGCVLAAFSLLRHRLLDVQVFVSRYVVYNTFTIAVVGAYLLVVGLIAQAIRSFGGDFTFYLETLFVFFSLLFVAAILLSANLRKRIKIFIDRHFYRNKHDYRKEWLKLTDSLSSRLDVREIFPPLAALVCETFWVRKAILWLFEDGECVTTLAHPEEDVPPEAFRWDSRLLRALEVRDSPLVLEPPVEDPAFAVFDGGALASFRERDVSLLVPLVVGERMVGVLGLSRSHRATSLNYEDFDLLKTIGKQAAGSFMIAQLSVRLVRAKELEAFSVFSTFVLHDLKNFVAMLSLILRNMERNFGNPEFQKDAVAHVAQTVEKMKRMMERLAALSGPPTPQLGPGDLNALVREVADGMEKSLRSGIELDLRELPPVSIDPEQIQKVITNLVLNAEEANGGRGRIRLETSVRDGRVALAVSDSGCGMTREFVENRLFRLFATTKSEGFGIGLYQTKAIVVSHGGHIEVESRLGKGSTFEVLFPVPGR